MSTKQTNNEKQQLLPSYASHYKPVTVVAKFEVDDDDDSDTDENGSSLVIAFILMLIFQLGNRVFGRLTTYPMHNYPFFMNIMSIVIYVPLSFMYIWPVMYFTNIITKEQRQIPKYDFAVMGMYDSLAGIMQVFAQNYITNAGMIVLVQQSAIPISMLISKIALNSSYTAYQYQGAAIVLLGIVVVLIPDFLSPAVEVDVSSTMPPTVSATANLFWLLVMVVSCVPMCLSSVYKEKALGETEIDVMYLNGWVAVFQLLVAIPLAFPSAWVQGLPMAGIVPNLYQGTLCWFGYNSVTADYNPYNQAIDNCAASPFYVNTYMVLNIVYNFLVILILKYGSSNILFMASTVIVPLSNVAFSMKFMPGHQPMRFWDVVGLFVILGGLVIYRFAPDLAALYHRLAVGGKKQSAQELEAEKRAARVAKREHRKQAKYVGLNQMESLQSLIQTRVQREQSKLLFKSPGQIRGNLLSKLGIPPSPMIAIGGPGRHSFIDNRGGSRSNSPQVPGMQLGNGKLGYQALSNFDSNNPSPIPIANGRPPQHGRGRLGGSGGVSVSFSDDSAMRRAAASAIVSTVDPNNSSSKLKDSIRIINNHHKPPLSPKDFSEV